MLGSLPGGRLAPIEKCYIIIPNFGKIILDNLPELGDSKGALYNDEPILGRSTTMTTYSHSEKRTITMTIHLFVTSDSALGSNANNEIVPGTVFNNLKIIRGLQSALYPRDDINNGAPFIPPPVCRIQCGRFLADQDLCVILRRCSTKGGTDVVWDEESLLPYKVDVDLEWDVIYMSTELPGQSRIISLGQ